jgi:hypothetical protein
MVRVIGILCGSAVAISLLIVVLGVPEFLPSAEETDVPVATTETEKPAASEALVNPPEKEAEPEPASALNTEMATEVPQAEENVPIKYALPETNIIEQPRPTTEHWYAFWSPFRSELAANGFVSQLQRTTGMDYRVVRLKPGVYEVAFAYETKTDIDDKLATISAATGLEMPDG